jgi:carbonic anhydrase
MKGVLNPDITRDLPTVTAWLRNGSAARMVTMECYPELSRAEQLEILTRENILAQVDNLRTHPCVAALMAKGELAVHAWHYSIATGEVTGFDCERGEFMAIDGPTTPVALPTARLCACRRKSGGRHVHL